MLHPIRALDHVIDSYRDYLTTEFRARDPQLRQALENALDRAGFLAQEPFFSAHRPFPQTTALGRSAARSQTRCSDQPAVAQ